MEKATPLPTSAIARVGVVILAYGSMPVHEPLFEDLLAAGVPPDRVIIVHNPSHQDELPPRRRAVAVAMMAMPRNLGYGAGMNAGIRKCLERGDQLVVLLTQDTRLGEGALQQLLTSARTLPEHGILAPVLMHRGSRRVFSAGGFHDRWGRVDHRRALPGSSVDVQDCDWVDGAALLVRREVFEVAGLLREDWFMYFEDAEFCVRAGRAGWRVGVVSSAIAHQVPGDGRRPGAYHFLYARNALAFARQVGGNRVIPVAIARSLGATFNHARVAFSPRTAANARRLGRTVVLSRLLGIMGYLSRHQGQPPVWLPGRGDVGRTARSE